MSHSPKSPRLNPVTLPPLYPFKFTVCLMQSVIVDAVGITRVQPSQIGARLSETHSAVLNTFSWLESSF